MPAPNANPKQFMTIDDIIALMKARMGLELSKAAIYGYISRKGFPQNIGLGTPRLWRRAEVESWIDQFERGAKC